MSVTVDGIELFPLETGHLQELVQAAFVEGRGTLMQPSVLVTLTGAEADLKAVCEPDDFGEGGIGQHAVLMMVNVTHKLGLGEKLDPSAWEHIEQTLRLAGQPQLVGERCVAVLRNTWPSTQQTRMVWMNRRGKVWMRGNKLSSERLSGQRARSESGRQEEAMASFSSNWSVVAAFLPKLEETPS